MKVIDALKDLDNKMAEIKAEYCEYCQCWDCAECPYQTGDDAE